MIRAINVLMPLLLIAILCAITSARLVFSELAVYGINRCLSEGLGPSTRSITLESPISAATGIASLYFNDEDDIVVDAQGSGSVGFLKHQTLMTGEDVDEHVTPGDGNQATISHVQPGDCIMAIIKHTPNMNLGRLQYDSIFKGHGDDAAELVKMFVEKFGDEGSFTLVTGLVKEESEGQQHYYTLIPGQL